MFKLLIMKKEMLSLAGAVICLSLGGWLHFREVPPEAIQVQATVGDGYESNDQREADVVFQVTNRADEPIEIVGFVEDC